MAVNTDPRLQNQVIYSVYVRAHTPEGTFRADGKYCQLSIICREKNAVISLVSECRDSDALTKAIFEEIYPQL